MRSKRCGAGWLPIATIWLAAFPGCLAALAPAGPTTPRPDPCQACPPARCTLPPAPALELVALAGRAAGCPAPWAVCLTTDAALAVEANLRKLRSWQVQAEKRCDVEQPAVREAPVVRPVRDASECGY